MEAIRAQAMLAREAALALQSVSTERKNEALRQMAAALYEERAEILTANEADIEAAQEKGLPASFIDRLTLNEKRIAQMVGGIEQVIALPDPVGEVMEEWTPPNGLTIVKRRTPLGVIAIIYESRPNVTVDAAALCLKSGNSVILRGGSDAFETNKAMMEALQRGVARAGLSSGSVSLVMNTSRAVADELMHMNGLVDVLIPRGGKGLIDSVVRTASVPVIQTGDGVCHIYVDRVCDLEMAQKIAVSAKISRPSTCNAAETLLVDSAVAEAFLPDCLEELKKHGVEIRGCSDTREICPWVSAATPEDYYTEYNDLIYSVKVLDGVDEAIAHINAHGTRHSEAIITSDASHARRFQTAVDAAAVYVNASTRFTDGEEFGFGAEIGISNQKLHARGPMGLRELTTYKFEITGNGQIR